MTIWNETKSSTLIPAKAASVKVSRTRCRSPLLALPLLSASDRRQGRKSRGGAAMSLAAAYGDLMPSVMAGSVASRGFDV